MALRSSAFALLLASFLCVPVALAGPPENHAPLAEDVALEKEAERLYAEGRYDDALASAEKLVSMRERAFGKDDPRTASALSDLGAMWLAKGEPLRAEPLLLKAVSILENAKGKEEQLSAALSNYASLLRKKSEYRGAEEVYRRVVAIEEKAGATRESALGAALASLGNLMMTTQRYREGETLLLRAVAIHEKRGPEASLLLDLNGLGLLYRAIGQYGKAADQYNRALPIAGRVHGPFHPATGKLHLSIGIFLTGQNQMDRAAEHFQKAEEILARSLGPEHPDLSEVYVEWAVSRTRTGDTDKALELWKKAQAIDERYLENALASGTETEKIQYSRRLQRTIDRAISFQMGKNMGNGAVTRFILETVLRHKGRVLEATAEGTNGLRSRLEPEDKKLYDEMIRVRGELASSIVRGPRGRSVDEHVADTQRLAAEAKRIETEIAARSTAFRVAHKAITIEAIQAQIPEDAMLLEFVEYKPQSVHYYSAASESNAETRMMVYALRHTGEPRWHQVTVSAAEIHRKVSIIRRVSQDPEHSDFGQQFGLLYSVAFGPMVFAEKGLRHLIISPDGPMALAPLAATVTPNQRFLIEEYALTYVSSGRDLLRFANDRPKPRSAPMIVANPDYDAPGEGASPALMAPVDQDVASVLSRVRFAPLPGTAEEAEAIRKRMPDPRVRVLAQATETELKNAHGPKIVHIATHGFFLDEIGSLAVGKNRGLELEVPKPGEKPPKIRVNNPMFQSALALAGANVRKGQADDGILTAYEVSALDLTGTELVVLSACETGVGSVDVAREGVQGLRRAFVVAGAETQVMSLWQVDDIATRDLMTSYYKKLFQEGKGRGEAMREAQLEMMRMKGREHPFYWASFIVSGDYRPLSGISPGGASEGGSSGSASGGEARLKAPLGGARGCGCLVAGELEGQSRFAWVLPALLLARRSRRRARARVG